MPPPAADDARAALGRIQRALSLEAPILVLHPELLWQQLFNQLQGRPGRVESLLASQLPRHKTPWMRLLSQGPWLTERAALGSWAGNLPLAFSPDGTIAWSADDQGNLIQWDAATGRPQVISGNFCQYCRMLMYDSESAELVAVGQDGELVRCDPVTGSVRSRSRLLGEKGEVAACKLSGEGLMVLVTYPDHSPAEFRFVECRQGDARKRTAVPLGFGYLIQLPLDVLRSRPWAVCPYGERARDVALLDYRTGKLLHVFQGHRQPVSALCVVENRDLLATGSQDRSLRFWRLSTGELLHAFEGIGQPHDLLWSKARDALIALVGSQGMLLVAWHLAHPQQPGITHCTTQYAGRGVLSPDEQLLYTGSVLDAFHPGDRVRAWDVGELLAAKGDSADTDEAPPDNHDSEVVAIRSIHGGSRAVTVSRYGQVWLWDEATSRPLWRRAADRGVVYGFGVSSDGQRFAVEMEVSSVSWAKDGRPIVEGSEWKRLAYPMSPDTREPLADASGIEIRPCPLVGNESQRESRSPAGRWKFVADDKDGVHAWDQQSNRLLAWIPLPHRVTCVEATRGARLFIGDAMGCVWHVEVVDPVLSDPGSQDQESNP